MKRLFLLSTFLFIAIASFGQYKPLTTGSSVKFSLRNLGFEVTGSFSGLIGTINFDPKSLADARFDVNIAAATVNTDNSLRDEHLKGGDFFNVKDYPAIHLQAGKITAKGSGYQLTGTLTIKGKIKEVTFPFTATPTTDGYAFKGSFKINRKDFDVGGFSTISNEVEITLDVLAKKADHV